MDDLQDLYQQVILDHNKSPKNFGQPEHYDFKSSGYNPLCGDQYDVFVSFENDYVSDIHFTGQGCAISKASASLMTQALKGKTEAEIFSVFDAFQAMVTSSENQDFSNLGKLKILSGVCEFPARVKCASLCWHTLKAAVLQNDSPVTTE